MELKNLKFIDSNNTIISADTALGKVFIVAREGNKEYYEIIKRGLYVAPYEILENQIHKNITNRQIKLILHRNGLLQKLDNAINEMDEPEKTEFKIEWEYSDKFKRQSKLIDKVKLMLNLTNVEVDQLFEEALKI